MQQFLTAASPFCVYDEWCTRCKSRDTCPDIPVWLKNGVSSHSYIGHCWKEMQQNFGQKKRPDAQITFFIKYRRNNYLTPVNLIGTAGSGRSEVVLSAHWLITE